MQAHLVREIKKGLEDESLGDIVGRLVNDEGDTDPDSLKDQEYNIVRALKSLKGKFIYQVCNSGKRKLARFNFRS